MSSGIPLFSIEHFKVVIFIMEKKDILPEDLIHVESDLSKDDLRSVLFLLYGSDKPQWILEKLENPKSENFLHDFANHHSNWKTSIVEALTVIQCFEVIEKLGIEASEASESLLKYPNISAGLRLLYQLCESCTKKSTDDFIVHIKKDCEKAKQSKDSQLEVFLLHCIASGLVKVTQSLESCDFTFITSYFDKEKILEVEDVLIKFPRKIISLDNALNNSFSTIEVTQKTSKTANLIGEYQSRNMQVLIINQQKFVRDESPELKDLLPDHPLKERRGTAKDSVALQLLFESFRYSVTLKHDLKHQEILKEVQKATKKASTGDGLIVCVLSHGQEGIVYGHDSIPVRIKDIKKIMATKILFSKTKILLIQACQGDSRQVSVKKKINEIEHDGPGMSTLTSGSVFADFLIFWSTIEGFASFRHVEDGSWFIQELVKKIRELHKEQHLMDICTAVIREVSSKRSHQDECMLPKLEATFTRSFRFPETKKDSHC